MKRPSVRRKASGGPPPQRTPTDPSYLRDLFNGSARYYDTVNLITSLGQVTRWRKELIGAVDLHGDERVLDAFCGPGGLSELVLPSLRASGELVLVDLSPAMLREARSRLIEKRALNQTCWPRVRYVVGDLLRDELNLGEFDVVLLGWALRYVPDTIDVLRRMRSLLTPAGLLAVLEFTRPSDRSWAAPAHFYFRRVLPVVGSWLAGDRELHAYLKVSAAATPEAAGLARECRAAGLAPMTSRSHLGGLVTILVCRNRPA